MKKEILCELFKDKAFVKELVEMQTDEARQTALKAKGVDVTLEEINAAREALMRANADGKNGLDGELDEKSLEGVAGGFLDFIACWLDSLC